MSNPRLVIGKYNDGVTFGLRCSLHGVNALTGDSSQPGTFSFDSEWSNIAQLNAVGLVSPVLLGNSVYQFTITWPALGYYPFLEGRLLSGSTVYDDYANSSKQVGTQIRQHTSVGLNQAVAAGPYGGFNMLYVVYKIQIPNVS